jgi:hypothetical protein
LLEKSINGKNYGLVIDRLHYDNNGFVKVKNDQYACRSSTELFNADCKDLVKNRKLFICTTISF